MATGRLRSKASPVLVAEFSELAGAASAPPQSLQASLVASALPVQREIAERKKEKAPALSAFVALYTCRPRLYVPANNKYVTHFI